MREKLLSLSLLLTSLIGYLEWGGGHSTFLIQAEAELFSASLLALMFVIGLISLNPRILSSTLPFLTLAALTVRQHSRARAGSPRPPVP